MIVFNGVNDVFRGFINCKERKWMLIMNLVFVELWDYILNVLLDMKFFKIKIFWLVISYIKFLMEILEDSNDGKFGWSSINFVVDLFF